MDGRGWIARSNAPRWLATGHLVIRGTRSAPGGLLFTRSGTATLYILRLAHIPHL